MRKKKGLSPLIAAVILIAATMIVAGILAAWTARFTEERLEEAAVVTGGTECFGARVELRLGSYSDVSKDLKLILDNKRSIDLTLTNLFLIYSDKIENKTLDVTLKGNEIKTITVDTVNDGFLTGEIKTNCPDVSVYFTYDQVT